MEGYEVERIAHSAAQAAAGDIERALRYEIDSLRRDLSSLERDLEAERSERRSLVTDLSATIAGLESELRDELAATNRVLASRTDHLA